MILLSILIHRLLFNINYLVPKLVEEVRHLFMELPYVDYLFENVR
jgi:hypothetical protein